MIEYLYILLIKLCQIACIHKHDERSYSHCLSNSILILRTIQNTSSDYYLSLKVVDRYHRKNRSTCIQIQKQFASIVPELRKYLFEYLFQIVPVSLYSSYNCNNTSKYIPGLASFIWISISGDDDVRLITDYYMLGRNFQLSTGWVTDYY